MRQLAVQGLWATGLAALARLVLTRGRCFVLTFHGVASRRRAELPAAAQPSFDVAELRAALRWIRHRFDFLTPSQLLHGERGGVLLTFDDGFANNAENALPVLEELEAPAVFFVTTQHVHDPRDWLPASRATARRHWRREDLVPATIARDFFDGMSRDQLAMCAEHPLLTIGSHTVSHPFLTQCDDVALTAELTRSKAQLESWCGRVDLFAYPTGDYDLRVARAARAAGYLAAFVEDSRDAGMPAYEIPRIGLYDCRPPYLAAKLSGLHRPALSAVRLADLEAEHVVDAADERDG